MNRDNEMYILVTIICTGIKRLIQSTQIPLMRGPLAQSLISEIDKNNLINRDDNIKQSYSNDITATASPSLITTSGNLLFIDISSAAISFKVFFQHCKKKGQ